MIKATALIFIFTALVCWLAYLFPKEMIAPGNLAQGHLYLEDNCSKCHINFRGPSGVKCVECHTRSKIGASGNIQVQNKLQFHSGLPIESCISCHREHKGSFVASQTIQFSHDILGIKDVANCVECHNRPTDVVHQQSSQNCSECHQTSNWKSSDFNHESKFRFDKDHPADCTICHSNNTYQEYTCYGCHEHSPQTIAREHGKEGIQIQDTCADCHAGSGERDIRKTRRSDNRKKESVETGKRKNERRPKESSDYKRKRHGPSNNEESERDHQEKDDD